MDKYFITQDEMSSESKYTTSSGRVLQKTDEDYTMDDCEEKIGTGATSWPRKFTSMR